jgi:hypothetical protein
VGVEGWCVSRHEPSAIAISLPESFGMDRAFGLVDLMMDKHSTPALPRFPLLQPDMPSGAKSGLTASKTASTNGLPTKGSRTGHNDTDPATRAPVPKAPNAAHPTATPRLRQEGAA